MSKSRRWMVTLASGCALLQLGGCTDLAAETLVRIGATALFTPVTNTITSLISGLTT